MKQFEPYKKVFKTQQMNYGFSSALFPPDNKMALDCLSTQWNLKEVKEKRLEDRCSLYEFVIQHLQAKFNNFNITRVYKGIERDSFHKYGYISYR
jgi:hypothetical protein